MSEANQSPPYKVCPICFYGIIRLPFPHKSASQGRLLSAPSKVPSSTGNNTRHFVEISSIGIWSVRQNTVDLLMVSSDWAWREHPGAGEQLGAGIKGL